MASEVIVTSQAYAGQWEAYQKDFSSMSLAGKIHYYEELGVLAESFERVRKRRWLMLYWAILAFPILLGVLFPTYRYDSFGITDAVPYFIAGALFYGVGWLLTRRSIIEKKINSIGVLVALIVYTILPFFQPEIGYKQSDNLWFFLFVMGIILGAFYVILSGKGFIALREKALIEKQIVEENLRRELYSGALFPVTLKAYVALEPMEEAYLEEPSMLINMQQKEQYGQLFGQSFGQKAMGYLDLITGEREFSTGLRKAWNSFVEDGQKINQKKKAKQQHFAAAQQELVGSVGSIIVTTDRILYVSSTKGFQIKLSDLTSYYAQEGEINTLVLESKNGVRTLQTDAGPWIVVLLDRLRRRNY